VLKVLVVQYKLVTIQYFMDEMQEYEVHELYNALAYANSNEWEMTRWLLYAIIQTNSRKKIKIEDVIKFPWDKGYEYNKLEKEISTDDVNRLRAKSKEILKNIKLD